jgi:hypothetical protein
VKTNVATEKLFLAIGAVLVILGLVLPSSAVIAFLRSTPGALREQLILGGALFKTGLVLQGLLIMILGRTINWKMAEQTEERFSNGSRGLRCSILVGILLTALLLRLYKLDAGIWFDEIVTYVSYMGRSFGEILTTYDNQNNHFLYTLLARLSFLIFGESVWALRLPAVLFGVGSIWALYLFACEVATWREGLLSAGLLTFSYHHVWFSQNARGYTALLFWTLLSSWLLIRALRKAEVRLWLLYGVTTALGLFTHISMAFVAFGQGVVWLGSIYGARKENRREIWLGGILGFAVASLLTFQLYSLVLPQAFNWQGAGVSSWRGTVAVAPWKSPVWMMKELFRAGNISLGSSVALGIALLVFVAGLIDFGRKKSPIIWLLMVPAFASIAVIMAVGSTLVPRLLFFAMGFAAIIVVRGLMVWSGCLSRMLRFDPVITQKVGVGLCACAIIVSAVSVSRAYEPKQDYRGALEFVQKQRRPGDVILTVDLTALPYQRFYKVDWQNVTTVEELDLARSHGRRTWLVYTMPVVLQAAYPEIMQTIKTEFHTIKEFNGTLNGGNIVVSRAE